MMRGALALGACLTATACGLPKLPDIRTQWGQRVQQLGGLKPIYPPHESMRVGQLWIVDASAALNVRDGNVNPQHITSLRVSDALVVPMETKRQKQGWLAARFPKSPTTEGSDLGQSSAAFFKQPDLDTLEVAALPSYDLASLDQASFSASVPMAFVSFLAGLGLTQSQNLTVAPLGVEIAELPTDDFDSVVQSACFARRGVFTPGRNRDRVQNAAYNRLALEWSQRAHDAAGASIADYDPRMLLLRKVFYMRGINYTYHDSKAVAAALSAAVNARIAGAVGGDATYDGGADRSDYRGQRADRADHQITGGGQ
jgi:hypothetical protein